MATYRLVRKDPDKGFFGRQLWLPKARINTRAIKAGLEFPIIDDQGMSFLQLWFDDGDHLIVPREFLNRVEYAVLDFPIINVGPTEFPHVEFRSRVTLDFLEPDKTTQRDAFADMQQATGGLLNLACVAGDTMLQLNRGGKGFRMKIKTAYERANGLSKRYKWDPDIDTYIRSNQNGKIGLQRVKAIIYKGKRQTYVLKLKDRKTLRLTDDHEVLTTSSGCGWMKLGELKKSMSTKVIVDGERVVSKRKPKPRYKRLSWYPSHPFVRKQERKGRAPSYTIEEHRAVMEYVINDIPSLKEYRERLKNGDVEGLSFIDPDKYHVHHIDEDTLHNHPDNLEILPKNDHLGKHRPGADAFGYGIPTPIEVASITLYGVEDVYDIVCEGPHHNYVANGIVVHNCGKGKTIVALHHIAHRKVPALVVVNNTTLINQWQDRINEFLEVPGGVGTIQGPPDTWDWEGRGICLAMIHSLALRHEELPPGMDRHFGLVIYDEVHHLSAPLFSQTAPLFFGERHGLTATVNREDGLESVYQYHVGDVYHSNLTQDMKPRIYFQQCPIRVDTRDPEVIREVYDKAGRLSIPRLRNYLGNLPECNEFIATKLAKPLEAGRKVLALSHSVQQLRNLNEMFEDSGLCTGREKPDARLVTLRTKQLSFGTLQLVKEALDEDTLDTLFFLTAFGSSAVEEGGFNTLQQGMGRIQRFRKGKKTPVVVIIDHIYIPKLHRMCSTLKRQLKNWPEGQGGPLEFQVLRPYTEEVIHE